MKKHLLLIFPCLLILCNSCSIEKRHFRSGYHIEWKHGHYTTAEPEESETKENISQSIEKNAPVENVIAVSDEMPSESFTASSENFSLIETKKPAVIQTEKEDSCDILTKMNGDEISVKVLKVTSASIEYKRCDIPEGPLFVEKRSNVFMVKYHNGSKEVFYDANDGDAHPADNDRHGKSLGLFGPLSIVFCILAVLLSILDTWLFIVALPLALAAGIFGLVDYNKNPQFYLHGAKVMSIIGIILSGFMVLYVMGFLLANVF